MEYKCKSAGCSISLENAKFAVAMNCPVCKKPLVGELIETQISNEEQSLINSLPYVIAYPLKQTLLEKHAWSKINLFKDTFLNYLKYLGLLSASEFFNSELKDKKMVALFHQTLTEPSFGTWNQFIRECLKYLNENGHNYFCKELASYYEAIESGKKRKLYSGEIEYIDDNGDVQLKKQESTAIGMLINFRNRYLGHGLTLDAESCEKLWNEYFPIFKTLLQQLSFAKDYPMLKREGNETHLLHSAEINTIESLTNTDANIWIQNKQGVALAIVPFFIVPGEVALSNTDKAKVLSYESYTGKTIKFFSPEGIEKQTSGKILERLNLLLREKQQETPFTPQTFTKNEFLKRITEENKLLLDTLIAEKKIIPGVYQHREEIETKLREWIGARANIFFIAAEAGSGKTNLLAEIQKQYSESELPSLFIRAGRMEKKSLKEQICYLLNIDVEKELKNYSSIAGTQDKPSLILIDGLNEANKPEEIWNEIIELCKTFEYGSLKFVVTNRANTKVDLERYLVSENDYILFYGENKDNENGLSAFAYWLTALDMNEMKGAWENYLVKDKSRFKPAFSFEAVATFDRALYNQINNPLILRLFLEIYNGKQLPKKGTKHLNIWQDWLKTFSKEEQTFFKLLANEIWQKGENELLLDDLLKNETLNPYFTSDIINSPYNRLKNKGWISRYTKNLNGFVGFTIEGSLLYLLGIKLQQQNPEINVKTIQAILLNGTKLQQSACESFLCEEALSNNIELVANLIDAGNQNIDLCINPLLLYLKTFGAKTLINKVLENQSDNDYKALIKLDDLLNELELHVIRKDFLTEVMQNNLFDQKNAVKLGLSAIEVLDNDKTMQLMTTIDFDQSFIQEDSDVLTQLAICENKFANYNKALAYFEKALAIRLTTFGADHYSLASLYNRIGISCQMKGDYDKALEYYEKGLAIILKKHGKEDTSVATYYNNIGLILNLKGAYNLAREYFEKCLTIELKAFGEIHSDVAKSYENIGSVTIEKHEYDKALAYYEKSLAIKLKVFGEMHIEVAYTFNRLGNLASYKNEYDKALEYYEKSLGIKLKTLDEEHPSVAMSYYNIGLLFKSKFDYDKALEFCKNALAIQIKTLGEEDLDVANSYHAIAISLLLNEEYDEALSYYEKYLAIKIKKLGDDHIDLAELYSEICSAWFYKNELDKVIEYSKKMLHIQLKNLGEEHIDVTNTYNKIGYTLELKGEYEKAIEYYEKMLHIQLKTMGNEHPDVADTYNTIGLAFENKGEYDKALECYEKSLAIDLKILGEQDLKVAATYNNIGSACQSKRNYIKALQYYEKSLEIKLNLLGEEHFDLAISYNNIGSVLRIKREYDKALEYYEKSLAIKLKTLDPEHESLATAYGNIGVVMEKKGDYDKALDYYEKCLAIELKTFGNENLDVATSYTNIGKVWENKGDSDKALEYYEKCLSIQLKILGDKHIEIARTYDNIGVIWQARADFDKSNEYFEKSLAIEFNKKGGDQFSVTNSFDKILEVLNINDGGNNSFDYYKSNAKTRNEKLLELLKKMNNSK